MIYSRDITACFRRCRMALYGAGLLIASRGSAQEVSKDSTRQLAGVEITSRLTDTSLHAPLPVQSISKQQLEQLNAPTVAQAALHFAGVIVKDYGGLGGLKTISVRSLGANHTGVLYDGVAISDIQNGQIDLGKYAPDNLARISLYNAQPTDLLSTARAYSYGAALDLQTATFAPEGRMPLQLQVRVKGGSWGFINPALSLHYKAGKTYTTSFNAEYRNITGDYPFITENGIATVHQRRDNAGLRSIRLEQDNRFAWKNASTLQLKAYYYDDSQQLPGAVILYSTPDNAHLWNRQAFVQGTYIQPLGAFYQLKVNGKFSYINTRYFDPGFGNGLGLQDNHFNSYESYASVVLKRSLGKHFSLAYAGDGIYNKLNASIQAYAFPERFTFLNAFTARYNSTRLDIQGNALHTILNEHVQTGFTSQHRHLLTPAISASWKPFRQPDLRIRGYYKQIFRSPTFDELYYSTFGNPSLHPEYTTQYDAGITWQRHFSKVLSLLGVNADGYYNTVTNKIITLPGRNAYNYSVINYGKAQVTGVDAGLQASFQPISGWVASLAANYSFQQALDVSTPGKPEYKNQLPYTPRHAGGLMASIEKQRWVLSYNGIYSAYRYTLGNNTPSNYVPGFKVHDLNATYRVRQWKILAAVSNFTNTRYAIVRSFPMPGRSWQLGMQWQY